MNPTRLTLILLSALQLLLLSSCSQEELAWTECAENDDDIIFHVSMPGVTSRSYDNIQMGDLWGGFTVAAHNLEQEPDANGKLSLYFEKEMVTRTEGMGNAFRSDRVKWPTNKNGKEGRLRIYAFYPSLDTLKKKSGIFEPGTPDLDKNIDQYFLLHDISTTSLFSYRIGNLKVNRDISRHVDVVTAIVEGTKTENLYSGVNLEFSHKLSRLSFKAWNRNPSYKIEIAGVRIGGAIVSTTLNMEGNWIYGSATEKKPVEYIFRNGDTIVCLDGKSYNTAATATSIMGNGGWAMIIPGNQGNDVGKYTAWDGKTANGSGVYFSVLMRVIDNTDNQGLILYPYVDGATITGKVTASNKNSIFLVVEKATGKVQQRVYKNKTTKQYFSDTALKTPYTVAGGNEVREYAWAAIPYGPVWSAGYEYSYVLDYTNGLGVHATDDDAPGKTIITSLSVGVGEEKDVWVTPYDEKVIGLEKDKDFTQE